MVRDDGSEVPVDPQTAVSMVVAKKAESRSWFIVDASGQGAVLHADKHAIMRRVQIHARDLRMLDPCLTYPSTILGRERVIVLSLEHVKAIITVDQVLLRDPHDENVIPVVEELRRQLPSSNDVDSEVDESPFEFRALEVALEAVCSFLAARTIELETDVYPALDDLTSKISSRNLDRVRKLKSAMARLIARVQKVRDELEQLLDDDHDMANLYLSRKLAAAASSPVSSPGGVALIPASPTIGSKIPMARRASSWTASEENIDVEELEMLLEAYFMQIDGTLNKLLKLREYIDDTEAYINIQLDNYRNRLIQLELFISSGTVCLTIYSLVAAIFGMNIPYTWNNDHGYVFKWVVTLTGAFCALMFVLIMNYARCKGLVES